MDETGRTPEGSARRAFLKKAFAAGAAVWSAPVIVSTPAGRAWAQTYPEPGRPHEPDGRDRPRQPDGRPREQLPPNEPR